MESIIGVEAFLGKSTETNVRNRFREDRTPEIPWLKELDHGKKVGTGSQGLNAGA
jgi:hypothetical protein